MRPNFFMQNFVNFSIHTIKSQNAFYVPAGDGQISMVDVRDIASVASQVLTSNDDGGIIEYTYRVNLPLKAWKAA